MWSRQIGVMPGFELTEAWLKEEGVPQKGIWFGTYYSGEGMLKSGCKPVVKLRRALLQKVLIEECEVRAEHEEFDPTKHALGEAAMLANTGVWLSYLSYDEVKNKEFLASKKGAPPARKPVVSKK